MVGCKAHSLSGSEISVRKTSGGWFSDRQPDARLQVHGVKRLPGGPRGQRPSGKFRKSLTAASGAKWLATLRNSGIHAGS